MKTNNKEAPSPGQQFTCPFFVSNSQDCKVSCSGAGTTATQQLCYCETEDYENCPLFLSRLLRNSRPKFRGVLDLAMK